MDLELRIDKLILPDLPLAERRRIVIALEQELLRLLREEGLPPALMTRQNTLALDVSQVSINRDIKSESAGRHIAQTIYRDLMAREP